MLSHPAAAVGRPPYGLREAERHDDPGFREGEECGALPRVVDTYGLGAILYGASVMVPNVEAITILAYVKLVQQTEMFVDDEINRWALESLIASMMFEPQRAVGRS